MGDAVTLDARDPWDLTDFGDWGGSYAGGKGNSEGSSSLALALPL